MKDKSELERTVEYAFGGAPQIKPDEKRKWLGEFRERVILGLTIEQAYKPEAMDYVEDALKDKMAEIIIVNQKIPMEITSKYMKLAKEKDRECKIVLNDSGTAMGIVVASSEAVDRESVEVDLEKTNERHNSQTIESEKEKTRSIWNRLSGIFKK